MKQEDISKYRKMTEEERIKQIPNWEWFKSLEVGDKAAIFSDSCIVRGLEYAYMPVTIKAINEDGSVEVDYWSERFYYSWQPNDMDATIGLIPRRDNIEEEADGIDWLMIIFEVKRLLDKDCDLGEMLSIMIENKDKYVKKT